MSDSPYYVIRRARNNQFYFTLDAPNNEVIATSETYTTKSACKEGIEAVKKYAPIARTIDITD